jgi:hypothetical protein
MSRVLAVALLFAVGTNSSAQAQASGPTQELTALEHRWVQALIKKDVVTLDKILASTYADTDEEGHQSTKQDVMVLFRSGDLKLEDITLSDLHVQPYGSAAVVTGTAAQRGAYKGQPVAAKVVFTDTFVKTKGAWRVVSSQRTAVH